MTIVDPLGTTNTFWTGVEKECTFAQLPVGLYTITEGATDGSGTYVVTINWLDGTYLKILQKYGVESGNVFGK